MGVYEVSGTSDASALPGVKTSETVGSAPTETGVTQDDKDNTDVVEDNDQKNAIEKTKELEAKQQSKIVLDGPLSQVYTQALNLAYSKEDVGSMLATIYNEENNDDKLEGGESHEVPDSSLYVYCSDGDKIDQDNLVQASDQLKAAIDSGKYSETILAIESGHTVNSRIGLLVNLVESFGVKVCYTRKSALEAVSVAIESFKK